MPCLKIAKYITHSRDIIPYGGGSWTVTDTIYKLEDVG